MDISSSIYSSYNFISNEINKGYNKIYRYFVRSLEGLDKNCLTLLLSESGFKMATGSGLCQLGVSLLSPSAHFLRNIASVYLMVLGAFITSQQIPCVLSLYNLSPRLASVAEKQMVLYAPGQYEESPEAKKERLAVFGERRLKSLMMFNFIASLRAEKINQRDPSTKAWDHYMEFRRVLSKTLRKRSMRYGFLGGQKDLPNRLPDRYDARMSLLAEKYSNPAPSLPRILYLTATSDADWNNSRNPDIINSVFINLLSISNLSYRTIRYPQQICTAIREIGKTSPIQALVITAHGSPDAIYFSHEELRDPDKQLGKNCFDGLDPQAKILLDSCSTNGTSSYSNRSIATAISELAKREVIADSRSVLGIASYVNIQQGQFEAQLNHIPTLVVGAMKILLIVSSLLRPAHNLLTVAISKQNLLQLN